MMVAGFAALAWSSDTFVDGASSVAKALGISPFVIGMVIIGFGTSAPELCVSVMSGLSNHSNLSLGNAYGSDIFNIACILGISVLIYPLLVRPRVSVVAGVGLSAITIFASHQRAHEVQLITSKVISNILPICLHRESINIYFLFPCLITS